LIKNPKFEYRSTKQTRISEIQIIKNFFQTFEIWSFGIVSDFEIRALDLYPEQSLKTCFDYA